MIELRDDGVYQDDLKIADSLRDAAWNQGVLEMQGVYQKHTDTFGCQKCGHSYRVQRKLRFYPRSLVADYQPADDPGCPRCSPR